MQDLNNTIKQCIKGDRKAQQVLYEKHFQFLMSILYRYEHNQQDAVALLNQAFLNIITHLNSFDQQKPFLPWIKRIAINVAIDHIRSRKKIKAQTVFMDDQNWEAQTELFEEDLTDIPELEYEDYLNMMDALDEPAKTIFNLYAIDDYSHYEIAEKLDISERTSKRYLRKARAALQHMIAEKTILMKGA